MKILNLFYITNATLLVAHELDSAAQSEWLLFGLPGGSDFFVILHIPLLLVVLWGLYLLALKKRAALYFSVFLALAGICAFGIHLGFILAGTREFTGIVSQSILYTILAVSSAQIFFTLRALFLSKKP
jgi:hypothetical protein